MGPCALEAAEGPNTREYTCEHMHTITHAYAVRKCINRVETRRLGTQFSRVRSVHLVREVFLGGQLLDRGVLSAMKQGAAAVRQDVWKLRAASRQAAVFVTVLVCVRVGMCVCVFFFLGWLDDGTFDAEKWASYPHTCTGRQVDVQTDRQQVNTDRAKPEGRTSHLLFQVVLRQVVERRRKRGTEKWGVCVHTEIFVCTCSFACGVFV